MVHSLADGLRLADNLAESVGEDEIMVIGGGDIYAQAMAVADRLYITHVELDPAGDVVFPPIDPQIWHVVSEPSVPRSNRDEAEYSIRIYERLGGPAH